MAESPLTEYNSSNDCGPSQLRPRRTLDQVTYGQVQNKINFRPSTHDQGKTLFSK
jgi:hypothetical protein